MISIYIFVMGRKEKERREERTENEPLGGDWEGLLGEREEEEEGCVVVVVDFAMGAFNIKPWAINGQAGEQAGEGGRAGGKRASGRTEWSVSGNHVGCGRTDICTFTSCDRASDK